MEKKDHVLLGAALTVGAVEGWLDEHVDPETGYVVDDTLAIEGAAADSKAAGDAIAAVEAEIPAVDNTLSTAGAAADAQKTGQEIADLKSATAAQEECDTDGYRSVVNFINGSYNENTLVYSTNAKRICTPGMVMVKKGDIISVNKGSYSFQLYLYEGTPT